jgi:hypothetical protein
MLCRPANARLPWLLAPAIGLLALLTFGGSLPVAWAEEPADSEVRLLESARFLSSDELEGRGVETKGLQRAADYLAGEFAKLGLKTEVFERQGESKSPFQVFPIMLRAEMGPKNEATLITSEGKSIPLKLQADFTPLAIGDSGKFDLPVVFAGYGISSKEHNYDDFSGIDVKGKAVVILRRVPQQGNPQAKFDTSRRSRHAPFEAKLFNAYQNGAAAVVLVNDGYGVRRRVEALARQFHETSQKLAQDTAKLTGEQATMQAIAEQQAALAQSLGRLQQTLTRLGESMDPLLGFQEAGTENKGRAFPVISVRRSVIDQALQQALGKSLASIESEIDKDLVPQSKELAGWRITGEVTVNRVRGEVKNVVGVLEGEGPLADETIVIGAHYDHLGYGGEGSFVPNQREIHNGADDNASGTSALLEVARRLAARGKPQRRVVFVAFTAEERGLIGSEYYVANPPFDMSQTVAMLNMDMVGRLRNERLIIQGLDTAKEFNPLVDRLNEKYGFKLAKEKGGVGPSDHTPFYLKGVPVMHFFTDTHEDYHRPGDDYNKLNVPGMRKICDLVTDVAVQIIQAEKRPEYVKVETPMRGRGGDRPYFGGIPAFGSDAPGYKIQGVTQDGPAEKAGLQAGDVITQINELKVANLDDWDRALRQFKPGDKVKVLVLRGDPPQTLTFDVTLGDPR